MSANVDNTNVDDTNVDIVSKLHNMFKNFNFGCSYSCRKIIEWLDEHNIKYEFSSTMKRMRETGLKIKLNEYLYLSVQTESDVAGSSFAETAILRKEEGCVYCSDLGYDNVIRHDEQSDLFDHIINLQEKFKTLDPNFGKDMHGPVF